MRRDRICGLLSLGYGTTRGGILKPVISLRPSMGRFTEGFDIVDRKDAKALLY
jgi:hypothetical protein